MLLDQHQVSLPDDPSLVQSLLRLLPYAGRSWSSSELACYLDQPVAVVDQLEATLLECGLFHLVDDGRLLLADAVREHLLMQVINAGDRRQAEEILLRWRAAAAEDGNLQLIGECHEHMANIRLVVGTCTLAIAELQCALSLYELGNHWNRVMTTCWSLGSYYARHNNASGLHYLRRATELASTHGLPHYPRYAAALHRFETALLASPIATP